MSDEHHILLICTVGGAPEPIAASIKHWRPERVWFVVTPESASQIEAQIIPLLASETFHIAPGQHDSLNVGSGQDFTHCVSQLRALRDIVNRWADRGERYQVVVDFTGGTKCMSAALALHAHRWPCRFSYVGGAARTKENLGVVICGHEEVGHAHNPWDVLGYQAVEEAVTLFDQGALSAAGKRLDTGVVDGHAESVACVSEAGRLDGSDARFRVIAGEAGGRVDAKMMACKRRWKSAPGARSPAMSGPR